MEKVVKKLKRINVLNDYVAIMVIPIASGLHLPDDAKGKFSNEGLVVGVGPDAAGSVECGDMVIVRGSKYMSIKPETGDYVGYDIMMVHKLDMVVRKDKSPDYEVTE